MRGGLLCFSLISACISTPEAGLTYTFPKRFYALQTIEVTLPARHFILLAQVSRDNRDLTIVVVKPIAGSSLATFKRRDGKISSEWHSKETLESEKVSDLFSSILHLYDHGAILDEQSLAGTAESPGGGISFSVRGLNETPHCLLPKVTQLKLRDYPDAKIEVVTKEVECFQ